MNNKFDFSINEQGRVLKTLSLVFLFLVVTFLIPLVNAAPPVTTVPQFTDGLIIEYPSMDYILSSTTYDFHFHVFNQSNGKAIISGTTCYMHLYNSTGNHIYKGFDDAVSNEFDYAFLINGGNFTVPGNYYYIIQCNNSNLGGYSERAFQVTLDGRAPPIKQTTEPTIFLGLIVLCFVMLVISFIFKNYIFAFFAGILFLIAGTYTMINGFAGVTNDWTYALAVILIGLGAIITLLSGLDLIQNVEGKNNNTEDFEDD